MNLSAQLSRAKTITERQQTRMVAAYWFIRTHGENNKGEAVTRKDLSEHFGFSYGVAVRLVEDMIHYGIVIASTDGVRLANGVYSGGPIPQIIYDAEHRLGTIGDRPIYVPVYNDNKVALVRAEFKRNEKKHDPE